MSSSASSATSDRRPSSLVPATDRIEALAGELAKTGAQAVAVATDVTDTAQVQRLIDTAVERSGRIDV
jgi:NADP-dependent 3-hydroxy acid dehydrogenase YdfG